MGPGVSLFQGLNGQGKSNLLEALYILAIAKSPRASNDREVIGWKTAREDGYARVTAQLERSDETVAIRVDFIINSQASSGSSAEAGDAAGMEGLTIGKRIRVNGTPRSASGLVGEVNAVLFTAQDIHLVDGPPTERRRYLDILISQVDRTYLRALQKYQKVVTQRNHLLRLIREGKAQEEEIQFWDDELVVSGKYIVSQRCQIIHDLAETAAPSHERLTGGLEGLILTYKPSVGEEAEGSTEQIEDAFRQALATHRRREMAQGVSLVGPHRDDLQLSIDGMDAGIYASRGQARTVALSLRLAEAQYLRQHRNQEPILLLDDVLSEMDSSRREEVLKTAEQYQQALVTTTDMGFLDKGFLDRVASYSVHQGNITPMGLMDVPVT